MHCMQSLRLRTGTFFRSRHTGSSHAFAAQHSTGHLKPPAGMLMFSQVPEGDSGLFCATALLIDLG